MALIIEDGTGLPDADSYVSAVDCTTYHARRGNAKWGAATEADQEAALIRAVQYLDAHYLWKGTKLVSDQGLAWPRDAAGVPRQVRDAQCELALRALSGPLVRDSDGRVVTAKTIGPIKTEYGLTGSGQTYGIIDAMLRDLVRPAGSGTIRLRRG